MKNNRLKQNFNQNPRSRRGVLKILGIALMALPFNAALAGSEVIRKSSEKIKLSLTQLFKRGEPGYERARNNSVWNARKVERYPEGIFFPESDQDIVDAVLVAKREGLKIGLCSGGHNWIGNHIRDEGLLVNLSKMKEVTINTEAGTATIQPGVHGRDLQKKLGAQGFRFPTATCPTVALGGYLLGGGASFTSRLDGAACYGVIAADVVLASGELVHATDETHPDIMWAIRGSGPNFFGIVTRFYIKLKPLHQSMLTSFYLFPSTVSKELMAWLLEITPSLPNAVTLNYFAVKSLAPDFPGTPLMLQAIAFSDSDEQSRTMLGIFEKSPLLSKAFHHQVPMPWTFDMGFGGVSQLYPKGYRFHSDTLWVDPSLEGFTEMVSKAIETLPNDHSHILWAPYNSDIHHPNACVSGTSDLSLHFYGVNANAEDDTAMDVWTNQWMEETRQYSAYGGIGKINDNHLVQFSKYYITPEHTDRLFVLRKRYDPDELFHAGLGTPRSNTGVTGQKTSP